MPPLAVNVVGVPSQVLKLPNILAVGNGLAVTLAETDFVQPLTFVAVTVKVPDVDTEIVCVVALVDHK